MTHAPIDQLAKAGIKRCAIDIVIFAVGRAVQSEFVCQSGKARQALFETARLAPWREDLALRAAQVLQDAGVAYLKPSGLLEGRA